jgi:hypothetical protein
MKAYLGDGAYVDFDGYALILTAENGIRATDTIVLEPAVWRKLEEYVTALKASGDCHKPNGDHP